jgi:hypothetical protein
LRLSALFLGTLIQSVTTASMAAVCPAKGEVRTAASGPKLTTIVELYTSEGCNSCPPADKWFSRLSRVASPGQPFIPLAFHVDYWDYIGWRDRFAQPQFSDRQRGLVQAAGKRTVYTPQVFYDGADVGLWSSGSGLSRATQATQQRQATLQLALALKSTSAAVLDADLTLLPGTASNVPADLVAYVALVEQNLVSRVSAGENKNVTLEHAHTVRQLVGPIAVSPAVGKSLAPGTLAQATAQLMADPATKPADLSVVAYLKRRGSIEVLQAVALPLCELN